MKRPEHSFSELRYAACGLTAGTRTRLERSCTHALEGRRHSSASALRIAVSDATRELHAAGLADHAVLDELGALVEDLGRACGADRPSLMSGELRWVPVRARVLALANAALRPVLEETGARSTDCRDGAHEIRGVD